ncbi:uncharacterized protein LOC125678320 isoform X2 [Ostrea edulis]|uniref:uncharacterized protein LOC125678320 isoform X2 n=1 Tax=Ostrea edulis TaxID=37623 RepID=UPI0024AF6961|nr:uncharacterized protein LOC125678320 isoform X2 [Ostrea edulis]
MAEKTPKQSMDQSHSAENPIRLLLNDPKLSDMKLGLPSGYVNVAQTQYSILLSDLEKLKKNYPKKLKMLEMDIKEKQRDKKKILQDEFTHNQPMHGLVKLLTMLDAPEKAWDELQKLLNAKYFLEQGGAANSASTTNKSMKQDSKADPNTDRGGSRSVGLPASKSVSHVHDTRGTPASPSVPDIGRTFHGLTEDQREHIQNTSRQHFDAGNLDERPIQQLISKHRDVKDSAHAKKEYQTLVDNQTALYKGQPIKVIPRSSVKKEDCASASMVEVRKNPSQSERMTPSPIEKVLKKYELEHGKSKELDKARGQFSLLVNRDNNFKRKFPEKYLELQVFVVDPDEYPYSPYQCLYNILHSMGKKDPLYLEAWKQYFHLVTSDQQHIIAEHCGQMFKTVYRKEIDSMLVPRKSYEELQNELVEKIKQIEELTTRLSKVASQQLTTGNPNIADLSDKHRPTKIGELYSELYDNEWSEAFEVIKTLRYSNIKEESESDYYEDILGTLKDILMAAYEFSAERADSHLRHIKHAMISSITFASEDESKSKSMRCEQKETEYDRLVTEHAVKYRKEAAVYTVREASKVFQQTQLQRVFKENSKDPQIVAYIDKCVELTWYMCIQDPPMHLHCLHEKDTISRAEFAFHGRKGKTTSVCVWPALFLFRDGHLVTKGHVLPEP